MGYSLDLVVCTALGVDFFICVYPTRTAHFGVALVPTGILKVKAHECQDDQNVIMENCLCQACHRLGVSRARIHHLPKTGNTLAVQLLTQHNIAYMMSLVREIRRAIMDNEFPMYVRHFLKVHFGDESVPAWVSDALHAAGIDLN